MPEIAAIIPSSTSVRTPIETNPDAMRAALEPWIIISSSHFVVLSSKANIAYRRDQLSPTGGL